MRGSQIYRSTFTCRAGTGAWFQLLATGPPGARGWCGASRYSLGSWPATRSSWLISRHGPPGTRPGHGARGAERRVRDGHRGLYQGDGKQRVLPGKQEWDTMSRLKLLGSAFGLATVFGAVAAVVLGVLPASAATVACTGGAPDANCFGLATSQAIPLALSASVTTPTSGSPLVAVAPAFNRRQDFDISPAVSNPDVYTIRWAPRGVLSNLCVTETGGLMTRVRLASCLGTTDQHWRFVPRGTGFNVINVLTGLAMTQVAGTNVVQVRSVGTGTGLNKIWNKT